MIQAVGAAAEGAYSSLHWAVRLAIPENQRFVQAYKRRFGRSPSVYAVQGYDTARVIVEAVNALQGMFPTRAAWWRCWKESVSVALAGCLSSIRKLIR